MGKILREADLAGFDVPLCDICGIDEAGRGPLTGPVCAAAVILPGDFAVGLLDDSKALSPARRALAYEAIVSGSLDWAVGWATWEEIGRVNILNASLLAMKRAFDALILQPRVVIVDGNKAPSMDCPVFPLIKGDSLLPSIMAASILAKVARDRLMVRLDAIEPRYGFARHKGYPTKEHREAIKKTGLSLWARPGFRVE
ncbi:MAG TPA: ribonuclease HII [Rectinemataceae bacterium]|nr:ribonuclease HII [Rectinemataceae bacterium]